MEGEQNFCPYVSSSGPGARFLLQWTLSLAIAIGLATLHDFHPNCISPFLQCSPPCCFWAPQFPFAFGAHCGTLQTKRSSLKIAWPTKVWCLSWVYDFLVDKESYSCSQVQYCVLSIYLQCPQDATSGVYSTIEPKKRTYLWREPSARNTHVLCESLSARQWIIW